MSDFPAVLEVRVSTGHGFLVVRRGDSYKCKRRGHVVNVLDFTTDETHAYYVNARGERRTIPLKRLCQEYRFERLTHPFKDPAMFAPPAESPQVAEETHGA